MTKPDKATAGKSKNQRRATMNDMDKMFDEISEGASLRATCKKMGLHTPTTHDFIKNDLDLRERYARARELRAEVFAEEALTVTKAAALGVLFAGNKVEAAGARTYLDAIKWAAARMAPATAPIQRVSFENLSDAELQSRLDKLEKDNAEQKSEG